MEGLDGLEALVQGSIILLAESVKDWKDWKKTTVKPCFEIPFLQQFKEEKHTPQLLNKYIYIYK